MFEVSKKIISDEASRCVSCGLCLPHCPTYRLLKSEADSPRGRITLMSGVVNGRISLNSRFVLHMDRCLTCRACEAVCPNNVRYGSLIDEMRMLIVNQSGVQTNKRKSQLRDFLVRLLFSQPKRLDRLRWLFYFVQKSGWLKKLNQSDFLSRNELFRLSAQLPPVKFPLTGASNANKDGRWRKIYPAAGRQRGEVGLFLGCVARLTDVATLNSSIFVLNRLGFTVHVPDQQTCCGALHQHSGKLAQAGKLADTNKSAFANPKLVAIISTASGCGVQLVESGISGGSAPVIDINRFLAATEGWDEIDIAPFPEKILVHEPCSLRNVLCEQQFPYRTIERIPDVQLVPLAGNNQCCGAAGTYFMDQPEYARMLLNDKLLAVKESGARYMVTANVGCAMHIANGLFEQGISAEVLHPVTLLARQMGLEL